MATEDKILRTYNWPLNGRLITKLDGTLLPDSHFQVLENMRYNDGGIEGVGGMTKVKAAAFAKLKVQNGFHFKKTSPVEEDHIFVQVTDVSDGSSALYKSDGSSAGVPAVDTYTAVSEVSLASDATVYFAEAPDQSMVFCDGVKNYVYSGTEYRAAQVINFDPANSFFYDRTEVSNNNLTDSENIYLLYGIVGGLPAGTTALYHFNNNGTDATGGTNLTEENSVTYSTSAKFGTHCASLDGINDYFSNVDPTGINLSGGTFTIDVWVKPTNVTTVNPIYYAYTGSDDDSFSLYIDTDGSVKFLVKAGGVTKISIDTPANVVIASVWNHIALVENGDNFYIFVNGVARKSGSDTDRPANYTGDVFVGAKSTERFIGLIDELCITTTARWTSNFSPPIVAYAEVANTEYHLYVGSTRPLSGVKFYVNVANTATATCACQEWTGTTWSPLTVTDGTIASAGKTLSQTGVVTWASTVSTSKVKVINENLAYYYWFTFTNIDAATKIEMVTVQAPVQELIDLWDGVPRLCYSYLKSTTATNDETVNIYNLDYDIDDVTTYSDISAFTSSNILYIGFAERMIGLRIYLGENKINTNPAILYVKYWNGAGWSSVGTLDDGTELDMCTLKQSGTITWNDFGSEYEFPRSIGASSSQWHYYAVMVSATLSANVFIDSIGGIPAQTDIPPYRYPIQWQNRLFLLNDQSNHSNVAIGSSYGTVCVFNGVDSGTLTFGGMRDLECGATLFTRYGGSIYENLIVCKKNETYLVDGTSFDDYIVYKISSTRGCVAPLTMKVCDTGYEVAPGLTKHTLVWLSTSGVIMFDANSMIEISNDIGDRFEQKTSSKINFTYSYKAAAFYDSMMGGYHLLIPTGTSVYPNEEWVYDLVRKKWFQIKRGAKYLWCGFEVDDSAGNKYVYGGTGDGYLERLEYGTTFDGVSIAYKFRLPDSLMNMSWDSRKELRQIRLVGVCKTTSSQTVLCEHFADGSTTASSPAVYAIPQTNSGHRFYKWSRSVSYRGNTHSLQFSITTSDETIGLQPLFVAGTFKVIDPDLESQ